MLLHVITSMLTGGAERLVTELLPRFTAAGLDCGLAVFDATPTPFLERIQDAGIKVCPLGYGRPSVYNPAQIGRLRELFRQARTVHTHNTTPQFFGAAAWRKGGPKMVTTEHNTDNRRRHIPMSGHIDRMMYSRYDAIACCSKPVMDALREHLGTIPDRQQLVTIENGIDLTPYLAIPDKKPGETVEILMVSAFRPQKDHLTALRALAMLPDRFRLTLAGDGELRGQVSRETGRLGLTGRVTFTGNVADVPALYRDADIALLCTHHEGMSLSIIEAMASGLPLVASDVEGVRENVGDGAILVPGADPGALADAILALDNSDELRARTGMQGRRQARRFDIDTTAQKYITLYKSI